MKKILIIDDDLTFQKTMSSKLVTMNYEVESAYDGEEGLKMALANKPDLILLDIMMPKMDGLTVLKGLKSNKDLPTIPVLITSNLTSFDKISEGVALGVRGYIIKSNESLDTIANQVEFILKPTENK